jgi:hypothetical protein
MMYCLNTKTCSIVLALECAVGAVSLLGNSQTLEFTKNRLKCCVLALLLFVRLCLSNVENIPCNFVFFVDWLFYMLLHFLVHVKGLKNLEIIFRRYQESRNTSIYIGEVSGNFQTLVQTRLTLYLQ